MPHFKAILRLNRQRVRIAARAFRSETQLVVAFLLRPGPAMFGAGLVFAVGLAMIYGDDFVLGIIALAIAAVWGIGAWLLSEEVEKRKPIKHNSVKPKALQKYKLAQRRYRYWQLSVPCLICLAFVLSFLFVDGKRVKRQNELLVQRLNQHADFFVPANEPTPPNPCQFAPKNALVVILGARAAFSTFFPAKIIVINSDLILTLDRDEKGDVGITTDIYDQNDDFIAGISKNKFTVVNDAIIDRPDMSSLKVTIKHRKEQVLDVRYINASTIRILGIFRHPDDPELRVTDGPFLIFNGNPVLMENVCIGNFGTDFVFTGKR
jgi:hypothetical protein